MIKTKFIDESVEKAVTEVVKQIPKRVNKYTPHQGSRERFRRLARIYHSHPHDCPCKSCEMMDGMLKSRGMME